MTFRDCIQSAVETGRVSEKKGAETFSTYDRFLAKELADGASATVADLAAAHKALEHTTSLKHGKRWQRINEMQRGQELHARFVGSKDPARELQKVMEELELTQATVRSMSFAAIEQFTEEFGPKAAGLRLPERGLADIAAAAYGEGGSAAAKELAESVIGMREMLWKWANMYGANIPLNANARLPQTHDYVKVGAVPEAEWVKDHIDSLDWEVMRYRGELIPADEREDLLRRTYQGIINHGFDRGDIAQLHQPGLASRLNRDRFLYYKDSASYMEMGEKYGAGSFYDQVINTVEAMAKDISLLKVFGPHSDSMKEFTKRAALARASELNSAQDAGSRNLVTKLQKEIAVFEDQYKIHAWHVTAADGGYPAMIFGTLRTVGKSAVLGSSAIPSFFGDLGGSRMASKMFNYPGIKVFRAFAEQALPDRAKRALAAQNGVIAEDALTFAQNRLRYFGVLDGASWARRMSDISYRMGLASAVTQIGRRAQGNQFVAMLANHAHLPYNDLPFSAALIERGITEADWNAFRAHPPFEKDGAKFLRPIEFFHSGGDEAKAIAVKFSNLQQEYIRTAIIETSLRSRRALGEHLDPNSPITMLTKLTTDLMSFPIAMHFNHLRRIAAAPGKLNKIMLGGKYMFWMTMMGAAITQTKALAGGQNLHDMTLTDDKGNLNDFWARAFLNGGSAGIFGDLIMNNVNTAGGLIKAGPTEKYLVAGKNLTLGNAYDGGQQALYAAGLIDKDGKPLNLSKDAATFIDASIPDYFYAKLIIDRSFRDAMMAEIDPEGHARKQQWIAEEVPQGEWWPEGGEPEMPRLSSAWGE